MCILRNIITTSRHMVILWLDGSSFSCTAFLVLFYWYNIFRLFVIYLQRNLHHMNLTSHYGTLSRDIILLVAQVEGLDSFATFEAMSLPYALKPAHWVVGLLSPSRSYWKYCAESYTLSPVHTYSWDGCPARSRPRTGADLARLDTVLSLSCSTMDETSSKLDVVGLFRPAFADPRFLKCWPKWFWYYNFFYLYVMPRVWLVISKISHFIP